MAFDNTKYDVAINGVGYRIGSYQKSVANSFIPRIGGGDQEETDFSLLRSKTIDNFSGGQLQRFWEDDTSFYGSEGLYPIYDDGSLYPVAAPVAEDGLLGGTKAAAYAFCSSKDYTFIASRTFNTATNRIVRIDKSGTEVALTLPASLSGVTATISSMVIWNNNLHIATATNGHWYMSLSSTTVTEITAGSGYYSQLIVWKGQLYGTSGLNLNTNLYRYTGNTSSRSYVLVGSTGKTDGDTTAQLFLYGNRIYMSRQDGLYAYDGIGLVTVHDASSSIDERNFRFPTQLRGWLYYWMPDGMWRTNGSIVEKMYDISEVGFPQDVCVGKDRMWMIYRNSSVEGSTRFDRLMGYDYTTGNNVDGRVAVFNGSGMYTYARTSTFVKNPGSDDVEDQGAVDRVWWFNDKLYVLLYYEKTIGNAYFEIDTDELNLTGQKSWRLLTSIFDGDFPMVDKSQENFEIVLDGDTDSIDPTDTMDLYVRNDEFDQEGTWTDLGDFLAEDDLKIDTHIEQPAGYGFRQVQYKLEGTTTAGFGIRKFVSRYLLAPEIRWEWTMVLNCWGDSDTEPLKLADGTETAKIITQNLRGNIYRSAVSEFPVTFIDIDQVHMDTTGVLAATATIPLRSTDLFRDNGGSYRPKLGSGGFITIEDEVVHWDSISGSELVAKKRGALGTTAADHDANVKIFP
ncbi:hypothetical protein, partial [uncultured Kiloniella sp.]|uniref:hypothetical protein n=1 Tax=uncultured Kiloniella sp. TaxID=1133091 RepID=UPI00260BDC36